MKKPSQPIVLIAIVAFIVMVPAIVSLVRFQARAHDPWSSITRSRPHQDHSGYFTAEFSNPQEVTRSCLSCHPKAAKDVMKTAHWNWEGHEVTPPGRSGPMKIGKKNLINNFCIGIRGNERSCTSCHVGYGWTDATFDFTKEENVDCLICHDWTGTYQKGDGAMPKKGVSLLAAAKGVGYPRRENCGTCHNYGGGGMGVKHGDLDQTLVYAAEDVDVHMGKHNLLCIDCHRTERHDIKGRAFSVGVDHVNGIACADCHINVPHRDRRIDAHLDAVSCEACHIPSYARRAPTKVSWDWSKAGDSSRPDDIHRYLKKKGEFVYATNVVPEYLWFNYTVDRYLLGDVINPDAVTRINPPRGSLADPRAKIWPFKVHRATQIYDRAFRYLLQPVTAGEGGFWSEFNWDKAARLGEKVTGLAYSGTYGWARTEMHWPISHMVAPARDALKCADCHGATATRMNWKALGYPDDPADVGGRKRLAGARPAVRREVAK